MVEKTTDRLLALSGRDARGRFDPAKTRRAGMDGFRGWLWGVTRSKSVDRVRKNRPCMQQEQPEKDRLAADGNRLKKDRPRRKRLVRRVLLDSDLAFNGQAEADAASILKQRSARFERCELLPILEECINAIEDVRLRQAAAMMLDVGTTERDMATRLNIPAPTFHKRLHRAYDVLRPMLEVRGVEHLWFGA